MTKLIVAFRNFANAPKNRTELFDGGYTLRIETAVAQWSRRCATNRKVAGSIPDGVIGIFH